MRRMGLAVLLASALAACNSPPGDSPAQEVAQRLVGTWLRDDEEDGTRVRRVLVLEPGGRFREMSKVTEFDAPVAEHSHAGEWHFDGTNLKRRYTSVDGQLPAAPAMPYATFELKFESRNEFIGIDNVRKRQVRYRRVVEGTLP